MVYSVQQLYKMKPLILGDIINRITKNVCMNFVYSSKEQNHRHLPNKKMNSVRAVRWNCMPEGSQCIFIVLVHLVQYTRTFIIRWWDEMCVLNHNKPVWCLSNPGGCTTLFEIVHREYSTLYFIFKTQILKHQFSTWLWIVWKSVAVRAQGFIWVRAKIACWTFHALIEFLYFTFAF